MIKSRKRSGRILYKYYTFHISRRTKEVRLHQGNKPKFEYFTNGSADTWDFRQCLLFRWYVIQIYFAIKDRTDGGVIMKFNFEIEL